MSCQATKHGLSGLAHGRFQEEQEHGIRTTVIYPGLCDTPLVLQRPTPTPPEVVAKALKPDVAAACSVRGGAARQGAGTGVEPRAGEAVAGR